MGCAGRRRLPHALCALALCVLCASVAYLIVFGICFGACTQTAFAQEATAAVGVWQKFDTDQLNGVQKTFDYRMEALTPRAPLPDGAKDGAYDWQMTESQHLALSIAADAPFEGAYEYRLYQNVPATAKKDGYTYDDTVYLMRLYCVGDAGDQLMAIVYDEAGQYKQPDPGWTVAYKAPAEPTDPKADETPASPKGPKASGTPKAGGTPARSSLAQTFDALDAAILAVLALVCLAVIAVARGGLRRRRR